MQTVTITKAMREEIATKLTVQAVAKNGPVIAADLDLLNKLFWAKHCAAVESLPGLERKNWVDLILSGTLHATSSCIPCTIKKGDSSTRKNKCVAIGRSRKDDINNTLIKRIIESKEWCRVESHLVTERYGTDLIIQLKSPSGSVPFINGMDELTDPVLETLALRICEELQKIVNHAKSFRDQVMDVLMACRTSRQLENLFPEAAKLLPKPVKTQSALAPVELASSVRAILTKGIPPVVATKA